MYGMKGDKRPSKTLEDFRDDLRVQAPSWSYQISECRKNGDPVAERMYRGFQLVDEQSLREIDAELGAKEFDSTFTKSHDGAAEEFDAIFGSDPEAEFDRLFDPAAQFDAMFS
jgi:hypothetical protein